MEISAKTDFYTALVASGYSPEEAERITAFLNRNEVVTEERLADNRRLHIAETLSLHWLVNELRKRALSRDSSPAVAVEALRVLADISARFGWVLKG